MRNTMLVTVVTTFALAATMACGGSPLAGPSPVAVAPPTVTLAAARALPAGLDPAYVRALAVIDADGRPKRWEGGPFHHCFDASVEPYRADLEAVADRMTALSGIPQTMAGACNVEWVADGEVGHTFSNLGGTDTAIFHATVTIRAHGEILPALALHEGGHILGLNHSPMSADLMNVTVERQRDFSPDEVALLAWMYGR
jgi:hypothetical protein